MQPLCSCSRAQTSHQRISAFGLTAAAVAYFAAVGRPTATSHCISSAVTHLSTSAWTVCALLRQDIGCQRQMAILPCNHPPHTSMTSSSCACMFVLPVCSKTYCPYCIKAKKALGQFLQPNEMEVVEVGRMEAAAWQLSVSW